MKRAIRIITAVAAALALVSSCGVAPKISTTPQDIITVNRIDEFTGEYILKTKFANLAFDQGNWIWASVEYNKGLYWLDVSLHMYDAFSVDKGDILYLKLLDGAIIELESLDYVMCEAQHAQYVIPFTATRVMYQISEDDLRHIANQPVAKLRVYTSNGYYELSPKEEITRAFSNFASVALKEASLHYL